MVLFVFVFIWVLLGVVMGVWFDVCGICKLLLIVVVFGFFVCLVLLGFVGGFVSLIVFCVLMGIVEGLVLLLL